MHLFQVILGPAVAPDVCAFDFSVAQLEPEPPQLGRVLVRQSAVPPVLALPDHEREVIHRSHGFVEAPSMECPNPPCEEGPKTFMEQYKDLIMFLIIMAI